MAHYECRYCDSGFLSGIVDGDRICSSCGAEWEVIKIIIEDDE